MWSQTIFQSIAAIGIVLTALGQWGSYKAGQIEAEAKEQTANDRIDQLQTALTIAVEENAQLVSNQTAKAIEKSTKEKIRAEYIMKAQEKLNERLKKIPTAQERALGGGYKR